MLPGINTELLKTQLQEMLKDINKLKNGIQKDSINWNREELNNILNHINIINNSANKYLNEPNRMNYNNVGNLLLEANKYIVMSALKLNENENPEIISTEKMHAVKSNLSNELDALSRAM